MDVKAKLGDGNNDFTLAGDVKRSLQVETGGGVDTVTIANGSKVFRDAKITLGGGDDNFLHAGSIGRALTVDGGVGIDTYTDLGGTAKVVRLNSIEQLT